MIPRPMRLTVVALTLSAFVAVPGAVADIILSGTIDSGTTVTVPVGEAGTMDGSLVNNGTIDVGGAGTALYSPPWGSVASGPWTLTGTGLVSVHDGAVFYLDAAYWQYYGSYWQLAPVIRNDVTIGADSALHCRQAVVSQDCHPDWGTLAGTTVNHGTINVGGPGFAGGYLEVSGPFTSDGQINIYSRTLQFSGDCAAQVGGQVYLSGGTFQTTGSARIAANAPAFTGNGSLSIALASGTAHLSGGGSDFTLYGSVAAGAGYDVSEGVVARLDFPGIVNDGQIVVSGTGATLSTQAGGSWGPLTVSGRGGIVARDGGVIDLNSGYWQYYGSNATLAVTINNDVTIELGGVLNNRQACVYNGDYHPYWATLTGMAVNHGTINVGSSNFTGSHLDVSGPFTSDGQINIYSRGLQFDGDYASQIGGRVHMESASFQTTGSARVSANSPVFTGNGSLSIALANGTIHLSGAGSDFTLYGSVAAGAGYSVEEGVTARVDHGGIVNDGQIVVAGTGSAMLTPMALDYGCNYVTAFSGSGRLVARDGGGIDLASGYYRYYGDGRTTAIVVNNELTIEAGGVLSSRQAIVGADCYPYWSTLAGAAVNHGTVSVGGPDFAGSHLDVTGPFTSDGQINVYGRTLQFSGDHAAQLGGQMYLEGGCLQTAGSARIAANSLTISITGRSNTIDATLDSGLATVQGPDRSAAVSLYGAVRPAAMYRFTGMDVYVARPTFQNDGTMQVMGENTVLWGPRTDGGFSGETRIAGRGLIRIGSGARFDIASGYYRYYGDVRHQWTVVDNDITVEAGGTFDNDRAIWGADWYPTASYLNGKVLNRGTFENLNSMSLYINNDVDNRGTFILWPGDVHVSGNFYNSGTLVSHGQTFKVAALTLQGGTWNYGPEEDGGDGILWIGANGGPDSVKGTGRVGTDRDITQVRNWGSIRTDGQLTIHGSYVDYDLVAGPDGPVAMGKGSLIIDIANASHYGCLAGQSVEIAGGISIELLGGAHINAGDTYDVVTGYSYGYPLPIFLPTAANGAAIFEVDPITYSAAGVIRLHALRTIVNPIAGDANCDDIVDQADYTVWYNHYGAAGGWTEGDFTGDGIVDQADYTVWYNNYGATGGSVPEPASLMLLLLGGAAMLRRKR